MSVLAEGGDQTPVQEHAQVVHVVVGDRDELAPFSSNEPGAMVRSTRFSRTHSAAASASVTAYRAPLCVYALRHDAAAVAGGAPPAPGGPGHAPRGR